MKRAIPLAALVAFLTACPGQNPEPKSPTDRPGPAGGSEDGGTETGSPKPAT